MSRFVFSCGLVITFFSLCCISHQAVAQSFNNVIFFGDSNTDNGRYGSIPQNTGDTTDVTGIYTTPNGKMWSVDLAAKFGYSVSPNLSTVGGTQIPAGTGANNNYAAGNAHIDINGNNVIGTNAWSTNQQITSYLSTNGQRADGDALYVFYIGTNDLKSNYLTTLLTTTSLGSGFLGDLVDGVNNVNGVNNTGNFTALSATDITNGGGVYTSGLNTLASQAANEVATLHNAGARYIVIPNISDSTQAAAAVVGQPWTQLRYDSVAYYNRTMWNDVAAQGINFIPADYASIDNYIALNAKTFGFTHTLISSPACGAVQAVNCTLADLQPDPNSYIFADTIGHFGAAAQTIEADYVYSLLTAPSEISQITNAPVQTNLQNVETIRDQIRLSAEQSQPVHVWASGQASALGAGTPSTGFSGTTDGTASGSAGIDYSLSRHWLIGLAVASGVVNGAFEQGGGYTQVSEGVSPYLLYQNNSYWFSAIGTWDAIQNNVKRQIPLGITTQVNDGKVSGNDFVLALEAGKTFENRLDDQTAFLHGPVVGLVTQYVTTDGFSETNPSGAPTTLSYGRQFLNSDVSQIGYSVSLKTASVAPFVKASWDHEWAHTARLINTSLNSVAAPTYTMPAVVSGKDWASVAAGVSDNFTQNLKGYVSFNTFIGQSNSAVYSGTIGINFGF